MHDSFDDARQALQPLPPTLAKQAAASVYKVSNAPQIGTWIQQLQASNIVGTITSLSGFTNRYYDVARRRRIGLARTAVEAAGGHAPTSPSNSSRTPAFRRNP